MTNRPITAVHAHGQWVTVGSDIDGAVITQIDVITLGGVTNIDFIDADGKTIAKIITQEAFISYIPKEAGE